MFGLSNFIITEFLLIFYSLVTNVLYSYTSNSNAGLRCLQGEVDGCITTKAVVKTYNLKELINYGAVPMGFTVHILKER